MNGETTFLIMNHLCAYKVRGVGTAVSGWFSLGHFPSHHFSHPPPENTLSPNLIILGQLLSPHFSNPDNYPSIIFRPGQFFPHFFSNSDNFFSSSFKPRQYPARPIHWFRTIYLPTLSSLSTINSNMAALTIALK